MKSALNTGERWASSIECGWNRSERESPRAANRRLPCRSGCPRNEAHGRDRNSPCNPPLKLSPGVPRSVSRPPNFGHVREMRLVRVSSRWERPPDRIGAPLGHERLSASSRFRKLTPSGRPRPAARRHPTKTTGGQGKCGSAAPLRLVIPGVLEACPSRTLAARRNAARRDGRNSTRRSGSPVPARSVAAIDVRCRREILAEASSPRPACSRRGDISCRGTRLGVGFRCRSPRRDSRPPERRFRRRGRSGRCEASGPGGSSTGSVHFAQQLHPGSTLARPDDVAGHFREVAPDCFLRSQGDDIRRVGGFSHGMNHG